MRCGEFSAWVLTLRPPRAFLMLILAGKTDAVTHTFTITRFGVDCLQNPRIGTGPKLRTLQGFASARCTWTANRYRCL